jgi:hypothetical protein
LVQAIHRNAWKPVPASPVGYVARPRRKDAAKPACSASLARGPPARRRVAIRKRDRLRADPEFSFDPVGAAPHLVESHFSG